jgi:hypothetical protein
MQVTFDKHVPQVTLFLDVDEPHQRNLLAAFEQFLTSHGFSYVESCSRTGNRFQQSGVSPIEKGGAWHVRFGLFGEAEDVRTRMNRLKGFVGMPINQSSIEMDGNGDSLLEKHAETLLATEEAREVKAAACRSR